jgi:predicted 2-oxoglutarate/Fe(II)-dependent dioxygenase YbiX/peroxiredoxin
MFMPPFVSLAAGDPAPRFYQRTLSNPRYAFHSCGGRYVVLCFFGSSAAAHSRAALDSVLSCRGFFDEQTAAFFGFSVDPCDESEKRLAEMLPGYRYVLDFDGAVSRAYGALSTDACGSEEPILAPKWVILDPTLRVLRIIPFAEDQSDITTLLAFLNTLPPPGRFAGIEVQAPVLYLPNVFEPALCEELIRLYEQAGGEESGFMREVDGKTISVTDHRHKRRKDHTIESADLRQAIQARIHRRVASEIQKAYQFKATRMERYIVACYAAEDAAHFAAHRDNTTKGTAHRRFAVSINLNDDFDGGEVSFPEYGRRSFKALAGGAVVFSCSLLHDVSRVERGRRYAFLPFLYDDEAAKIHETSNAYLGEGVQSYRTNG